MTKHYYGQEISAYGLENGYVDYAAFARSFNHVLANDLYYTLCSSDDMDIINDYINEDEIMEIEGRIEELEDEVYTLECSVESLRDLGISVAEIQTAIDAIYKEMGSLQREVDEMREPREIFQWYVVDDTAVSQLEDANEMVVYFSGADVYMWGVTHYGTSWDYVLTNIKLDEEA